MEVKRSGASVKGGRTFDGAYGFSFAIGLGLVLFIAGLVLSLTLGEGSGAGLLFGIPLLLAGLILPLFMMRDIFAGNSIEGACPACGTSIKTSGATIRLSCPGCEKPLVVQDAKFVQVK
ncbi:MAG TPA: hypothetical protein VGX92_05570 [Pyrinomonadaceae bacterium]|jgi:hypothetical protein|nr:hypothetical protein [Pyrinomonadaceae bacterium]